MTSADPRIAILMTCHNRRETTLRCLRSLVGQTFFRGDGLFLVDDGSSDGTGQAVREMVPDAHVLAGDGTLYWNGGMRRAWQEAKSGKRPFDHYLWLNDDVVLAQGALEALVRDADAAAGLDGAVIVAAATREPGGETITYGGHRRLNARRPLRLTLVAPEGRPLPIDTISGNIVLVSAAAERRLGNLSPVFTHIYGDLDYGLRAQAAGIPIVLASDVAGECAANAVTGSSLDPRMSRLARLRARWREERKIHAADWRRFVRLHGGGRVAAWAYSIAPYIRLLFNRPSHPAAQA